MHEFIGLLQSYYAAEVLIGLSVLLVLVDYYFPTDKPAHFGYFCFGAGMFFLVPLGIGASIAAALGFWFLLAILHQVWFKHFLTNAPGVQSRQNEPPSTNPEQQPNADPE